MQGYDPEGSADTHDTPCTNFGRGGTPFLAVTRRIHDTMAHAFV